ncbi:hypothetical protein GCM10007424_25670 [Flavobacterium suaedae]|uniref:DUF4348 domain-containing protein n=1 Tax=Flavobacterium suaedae TaxID=1767027 RepID=A0ABQ1K140_9FLAO|nr:DUF4348 domain-containing protein [Flavobacterium suaedae]GGB84495.1 hypothetical protein GCM10007424_25670 [Flavobacterium suaedae]
MKKYFILIITLTTLIACKKKVEKTSTIKSDNVTKVAPSEEIHLNIISNFFNDKEFEAFFIKFASDSTFQKSRFKFPVKRTQIDNNLNHIIRKDLTIENYMFFNFKENINKANRLFNDIEIEVRKNNDSVHYNITGMESGINTDFIFHQEEGKWLLVEINDKST